MDSYALRPPRQLQLCVLSGWADLNCRPLAPKASALPDCATPRFSLLKPWLRRRMAAQPFTRVIALGIHLEGGLPVGAVYPPPFPGSSPHTPLGAGYFGPFGRARTHPPPQQAGLERSDDLLVGHPGTSGLFTRPAGALPHQPVALLRPQQIT